MLIRLLESTFRIFKVKLSQGKQTTYKPKRQQMPLTFTNQTVNNFLKKDMVIRELSVLMHQYFDTWLPTIFHNHPPQPSSSTTILNHHPNPSSSTTILFNHPPQPSSSTTILNHLPQPSSSTILLNHHPQPPSSTIN